MVALSSIDMGWDGTEIAPLAALGESHGISEGAARTYLRFFGIESVARSRHDLGDALGRVLSAALTRCPNARETAGTLVYCKTQTHNTLPSRGWLRAFANRHGLANWEAYALSMTSCASALVHLHFARLADSTEPMIVLTGEKAFHPSVSRLSVGLLAEIPAAALFNIGPGTWRIVGTIVRHLTRFYRNPDAMDAADRRALQEVYGKELAAFVLDAVSHFGDALRPDFVFLPHNLNLPATRDLVRRLAWEERTFQGDAACQGHGYCSDFFANLRSFEAATPQRRGGQQVLALAAGTGVTFAACLIEPTTP